MLRIDVPVSSCTASPEGHVVIRQNTEGVTGSRRQWEVSAVGAMDTKRHSTVRRVGEITGAHSSATDTQQFLC